MKITNVQATWVHVPIPYEGQHTSDFGRIASFDSVIVKIDTTDGLVGWGEAKAGVGSAASAYGLAAIINRDYAPLLVGQDPRDVSRLWDVMYNRHARATRSTAVTYYPSWADGVFRSRPSPASTLLCGIFWARRWARPSGGCWAGEEANGCPRTHPEAGPTRPASVPSWWPT